MVGLMVRQCVDSSIVGCSNLPRPDYLIRLAKNKSVIFFIYKFQNAQALLLKFSKAIFKTHIKLRALTYS